MERTYRSGVAVATAFVATGYAFADSPKTPRATVMMEYIEFITKNSSLEYAGQELPDVTIVSVGELQRRFRSSKSESSAKAGGRPVALVSALYDLSENRILLADGDRIGEAALFHELVHFLQAINGKSDMFASHRTCLEAEAYDLQGIWQIEKGIDLASKPDYGFIMTLYGVCNDADFSWIDSGNSSADERVGADPDLFQVSD